MTTSEPRRLLALAGFVLAYLAAYAGLVPVVHYLPVQGMWALDIGPGELSMRYFGVLLDAFAGALVGHLVGHAAGAWLAARGRALVGVTALLLAVALITIPAVELPDVDPPADTTLDGPGPPAPGAPPP